MAEEANFHAYTKEELDSFDTCLKSAVGDPWWNILIGTIKRRRVGFLEALATNISMEQRKEDVLRGQISELNFFIALDSRGRALTDEGKRKTQEDRNAR